MDDITYMCNLKWFKLTETESGIIITRAGHLGKWDWSMSTNFQSKKSKFHASNVQKYTSVYLIRCGNNGMI